MLWTLAGHSKEVLCVTYSAHGSVLASSSADCTIRLWASDLGQVCLVCLCVVLFIHAIHPRASNLLSSYMACTRLPPLVWLTAQRSFGHQRQRVLAQIVADLTPVVGLGW